MKCPYCGREVIYSDRFCKCGAELDMVVCPNCGTPNITLATFCGNCGHMLTNAEPYKPEEETEEPEAETVTEEEHEPEVAAEPEEEPAPKEAAVPEEEPAPEEPAVPEEEPAPEETAVPEEEAEPEEATSPVEEPEPEETAAPEEETEPVETPLPEEEYAPEEAPVQEDEPVPEETIALEEEPAPEEPVVPEEQPELDEAITPEEVPEEPEFEESIMPEEEPEEAFTAKEEPGEAFAAEEGTKEAAASAAAAEEAVPPEEDGNGRHRRGGFIVLWIVIAIIVVLVIVFAVLYTRGNREESTPVEETENLSDAETETDEDLAEDTPEEEVMPAIVSDISFERVTTDDNKEYAVLTGKEDDGNIVWEYTTPEYEMAELDRVSDIGLHGGTYYLIQDGAVVALDKSSGDVLWENSEYGGSPVDQSWAFGDNGLYLCGYEGPAIFGVSYDGDTLGKVEAFDNLNDITEKNLWPYKITVSGQEAMVYYGPDSVSEDGGNAISENEATVYSVNLNTWEYQLVSNGAAKVETTSGTTGSNAGTGDNGSSGSGSSSSGSGSGSNGGGTGGSGSGSGSSGSGSSGSSGGSSGSGDSGSSGGTGSGSQPAPAKVSMSDVKDVTASSYLYEANVNISHDPKYLVDGTLNNAWCEDAAGDGVGQWATVSFNGTYTVSGMNINAGYQKSESLYYENCRPKEITITFSDGSSFNTTLEDVDALQTVAFPNPVSTSSVTITIRSVYKGSKYEDTCISEVAFY